MDLFLKSDARISACGQYRYLLTRKWADAPALPFVMLNPSTADANLDDPTIRRCMGFARRDGFGGIIVANLFAFRATNPKDMFTADDPEGPLNLRALETLAEECAGFNVPIVCAWGASLAARAAAVKAVSVMMAGGANLVCLGYTKEGDPRHPLYVPGDAPLIPYGRRL